VEWSLEKRQNYTEETQTTRHSTLKFIRRAGLPQSGPRVLFKSSGSDAASSTDAAAAAAPATATKKRVGGAVKTNKQADHDEG